MKFDVLVKSILNESSVTHKQLINKYGKKFATLAQNIGALHPLVGDMFGDSIAFSTKEDENDLSAEIVIKPDLDNEDSVTLETIFVPESERSKGLGEIAMKKLLSNVDRLGMSINLQIDPTTAVRGTYRSNKNEIPMNEEQLRKWYQKFGFIFKKYGTNEYTTIGKRPSITEENDQDNTLPPLSSNTKLNTDNEFISDNELKGYFELGNDKLKKMKEFRYYSGSLFNNGDIVYANYGSVYTVKNGKLLKHRNTTVEDGKIIVTPDLQKIARF
jgi:hypothetical protein